MPFHTSFLQDVIVNNTKLKDLWRTFNVLKNNYTSEFLKYTVRDGETPETLAMRFYNSTSYYWIILLCNDMLDYFYDYPMSSEELVAYVNKFWTDITDQSTAVNDIGLENIFSLTDESIYTNNTSLRARYKLWQQYGSAGSIYETGLLHWSTFDDITTAEFGSDMTYTGTPLYASCKYNNGIICSSTSISHIDLSQQLQSTGSISLYIKPSYSSGDSNTHYLIMADDNNILNQFSIDVWHQAGQWYLQTSTLLPSPLTISKNVAASFIAGDIIHIVLNWDKSAGEIKLYINDILKITIDTSDLWDSTTLDIKDIRFGGSGGGLNIFDGVIDNVKIYDYVGTFIESVGIWYNGDGGDGVYLSDVDKQIVWDYFEKINDEKRNIYYLNPLYLTNFLTDMTNLSNQ